MRRRQALPISMVLLIGSPVARAQFCLESNPIVSGLTNVKFVTTADFNGDARPDIAVGSQGFVSVILNQTNGKFARTGGGSQSNGMKYFCCGDFDGDGDADILTGDGFSPPNVPVILSGLGNGTLSPPVAAGFSGSLFCARAADLNGDGLDDALSTTSAPTLIVQLQAPGGGLLPAVTYSNVGGLIVTGDYDNDGDLDVALAAGNLVLVMVNTGNGTLTQLSPLLLTPMILLDAASGDLDGDGDADLVLVRSTNFPATYEVRILWNQGPPLFQVSAPLGIQSSARPLAALVADLDTDGVNDLVITCEGTSAVSILRGLGAGAFAPIAQQLVGGFPQYAAVDDFDGDARPDLVTVDYFTNTATILFGRGDTTFWNRRSVPLSSATLASPMTIVSADLNGDSLPDIAATIQTSSLLSFALNQGGGSFGPFTELTVGPNPWGLVAADLDGDGDTDLATSNWIRGISVLRNLGGGAFAPAVTYSAGAVLRSMIAADLDGDADLDLAVVAYNSSAVYVLLNAGNGTFGTATPTWIAPLPRSIASGDIDADGDVDLVVGHGNLVTVMRNAGNGDFPVAPQLTIGNSSGGVTLSDLDNDSRLEIVVADGGDRIYIARNLGNAVFGVPTFVSAGGGVTDVRCTDLDGDGLADLAVASGATSGLSLLKNLGGLTFAPKQEYSAGNQARSIALADFDLDGRTDLAVVSRYETSAAILMQCPAPSTGFCFGDGTGSPCPCGVASAGRGCPNSSFGSGARLSTLGVARVSRDSLRLTVESVPNGMGLFVQGAQPASAPFGDGTICVSGGIMRLAVVAVVGQRAVLPNQAQPSPVGVLSGAISGSTAHFQFFYRDPAPGFCTSATINTTNGVITTWAQ